MGKVLPLIKRALKVLSDREVAPQLGLLKSTLLQLDSTFSEREYGVGSFRDFMEKVAQTGAVSLKHAGRSMMVESREDGGDIEVGAGREPMPQPHIESRVITEPADQPAEDDEESLPPSPMTMQDGMRAVQQAFAGATPSPRFPMYVRQAKQFLKTRVEGFDERKYGFASVVDLLRAAAKDGVLKLERDRHGAFRVFAGPKLALPVVLPQRDVEDDETAVDVAGEVVAEESSTVEAEPVEEQPIVDAQPVADPEPAPSKPTRKRKTAAKAPPRARKSSPRGKPLDPARGKRTKSEAADR